MPAGQTPHTTFVYAHNDLVDKVQPGDRVNITGERSDVHNRRRRHPGKGGALTDASRMSPPQASTGPSPCA